MAATSVRRSTSKILDAAYDAIDTAQNADLVFRVRNSDRSVGATVAGMIARLYGREGMPNHRKIKVRLDGEAGQSFGAWCVNGLDLELRGFAQDGVAKGISGGTVVVTLDYTASDYGGEIQSVAGNNVGYGATGGTIFIGGRAGHRLGIRNIGRDDRGRGRRQVRLRVHDPRPGADPRARSRTRSAAA